VIFSQHKNKTKMKNLLVIISALLVSSSFAQAKEKVEIKALSSIELTYEEFAKYDVKLSNASGKQVDVAAINPETDKQVSGFGLGPYGKAVLTVKEGHVLKLKNKSTKDISLTISFVEKEPVVIDNAPRVNFTLRNSSAKSIPLIIPNVMNPNLSPLSNSGVSLKMGQEIFYKKGMKKILILTVDESIKEGDKIDVVKLNKGLDE